ncbi:MAG TPA: methyltransferase domain-containing protein [Candidatus Limnocylindrales bacterium]|jgi:ubiquinone/menaquinone biosynthesis C-methylase UbiE
MDRAAHVLEHLDGPLGDRQTLAGNLRDLRRVNRYLGGTALSRRALDGLIASTTNATPASADAAPFRILDVGTGAADIPIALLASWRAEGRRLEITAIDSRSEVIEAAGAGSGGAAIPGLHLDVADGLRLPYGDGSFDVAHASLVLHHLEPEAAVGLLREMRRVARLGVVVNDLARGRIAFLGAWLLAHLMTGNAFTRHDAPLSVRRAYTAVEASALFERAGMRPVVDVRGFAGHRWALAARSR